MDEEDLEIKIKSTMNNVPTFNPICIPSEWIEPGTTTRRTSLAILLPSGVGPGDFSLRVLPGGRLLEIKVDYPKPISDLSILHKRWLDSTNTAGDRIEKYHPRILGFEASLKARRKSLSDNISGVSYIVLTYPVMTHIDQSWNLGWTDNDARVVYVDLKADSDNYGTVKNEKAFEIV